MDNQADHVFLNAVPSLESMATSLLCFSSTPQKKSTLGAPFSYE